MEKKNLNKGITLIALVITIIVLLILAGVAINMAIDSDGLFGKANEAVQKWNSAVAQEDRIIQNILTHLDKITNKSNTKITLKKDTQELEEGAILELEEDATLVLTAVLNVEAKENIVWKTSNGNIATVTGSGDNNITATINAKSAGGPVTITASYGESVTATCNVTVTEKTIQLVSIIIDGVEYYSPEEYQFRHWVNDSTYNLVGAYIDNEYYVRRTQDDLYLTSTTSPNYAAFGSDPARGTYTWSANPTFMN